MALPQMIAIKGDQVEELQARLCFTNDGHCVQLLSLFKNDGEELKVIETITSSWDPLWKEVDKEYEKDIANKKDLKFLSKKMFFF